MATEASKSLAAAAFRGEPTSDRTPPGDPTT
jgi:hypothetical protein